MLKPQLEKAYINASESVRQLRATCSIQQDKMVALVDRMEAAEKQRDAARAERDEWKKRFDALLFNGYKESSH